MKMDTAIPPRYRRILKKGATLIHPPYSHFLKKKTAAEKLFSNRRFALAAKTAVSE